MVWENKKYYCDDNKYQAPQDNIPVKLVLLLCIFKDSQDHHYCREDYSKSHEGFSHRIVQYGGTYKPMVSFERATPVPIARSNSPRTKPFIGFGFKYLPYRIPLNNAKPR